MHIYPTDGDVSFPAMLDAIAAVYCPADSIALVNILYETNHHPFMDRDVMVTTVPHVMRFSV